MLNYKESKDHVQPKQEGENMSRVSSSFTSGPWFGSKDPRIVRVSRAFGGKDRHSKVCTIRGLRDRRVRLSVPTAIQLYDLQDRLGLSQPSKVVDWLLDAAKSEIDELPPLPFIHPVNFGQPMFIDQSGGIINRDNWFDVENSSQVKLSHGAHDNNEEQDDELGSEDNNDRVIGEEISSNNNNPFLFPYGSHYQYSEPSIQAVDESHGFVSLAHYHHQLPSPPGNYIPLQYLRTSLVEMDHQGNNITQQLQIGSGSQSYLLSSQPLYSARLPFDFGVNARVAPSNNGGNEPDI